MTGTLQEQQPGIGHSGNNVTALCPTGTKSSDDYSVSQSINCQVIYIFLLLLSSLKIGHKRIMLFTNNDNPHAGDPALQVRFLKCMLTLELFIKPRSRRLGGFLLCLRFIFFFFRFVGEQTQTPLG